MINTLDENNLKNIVKEVYEHMANTNRQNNNIANSIEY